LKRADDSGTGIYQSGDRVKVVAQAPLPGRRFPLWTGFAGIVTGKVDSGVETFDVTRLCKSDH
jgi:hypothetical protein